MSEIDAKARTVHAYVAAFAAGDAAAAAALFAPDASVEDPVGSTVLRGATDIAAFYQRAMQTGARLALTGPVQVCADAAAFSFTVQVAAAGVEIDVIDVFRFDDAGLITQMQAFWGPANVRTA
jgi:steroid delta-isomerase